MKAMTALTLQNLVMSTFLATFTSGEVLIKNYALGRHQPDLDNQVFNDHVLFEVDVSTNIECARMCSQFDRCNAFTSSSYATQLTSVGCRGYVSRSISQTASATPVAGSKTYFMTRQATESTWLNKDCAKDDDCAADAGHTVCFNESLKCLCQPGYFYSHSLDDCVQNCSSQDLGSQFLYYPRRNINNLNMVSITPCPSIEQCKQSCQNDTRCRTFDFNSNTKKCFLQAATALDAPNNYRVSLDVEYGHYQRTCI